MPRYLLLAAVLALIQTCGRADDDACSPPFTDLKSPKYYRAYVLDPREENRGMLLR